MGQGIALSGIGYHDLPAMNRSVLFLFPLQTETLFFVGNWCVCVDRQSTLMETLATVGLPALWTARGVALTVNWPLSAERSEEVQGLAGEAECL